MIKGTVVVLTVDMVVTTGAQAAGMKVTDMVVAADTEVVVEAIGMRTLGAIATRTAVDLRGSSLLFSHVFFVYGLSIPVRPPTGPKQTQYWYFSEGISRVNFFLYMSSVWAFL